MYNIFRNRERHAICHVKRVQYSGELKIKKLKEKNRDWDKIE